MLYVIPDHSVPQQSSNYMGQNPGTGASGQWGNCYPAPPPPPPPYNMGATAVANGNGQLSQPITATCNQTEPTSYNHSGMLWIKKTVLFNWTGTTCFPVPHPPIHLDLYSLTCKTCFGDWGYQKKFLSLPDGNWNNQLLNLVFDVITWVPLFLIWSFFRYGHIWDSTTRMVSPSS